MQIGRLLGEQKDRQGRGLQSRVNEAAGVFSDVTDDYTTQNLSARQRDVMNLIVRKEISSILNLAEGLTAKECLQNAEVCLALAHKTKELATRADLLAFAYEFRTVAKSLERDERKLMTKKTT